MAYSFVQQAQGVALSAGTTVASSSLTVTAGNLLIVVVFASSTGTISIPTDSRGNTFTQGGDSPGIGDPDVRYAWFYCLNANGGAGAISASTTTTAPVRAIYVAEFSGLDQFIDDNFGYQATPTTGADAVSSGNANVTAQPALLFGLSFNGEAVSAPTAGSGFTSLTGVWDAGGGVTTRPQHRRVTATGDAAATFTATSNTSHYTVAIAFRETVAASATLSGATPSGTIASASVARLGATTDQSSGTLYAVIDSAANLSGITASQVKAGQRNNGSAALSSGNVTVSGASPWLVLTGLQPNTSYSYALVQNNANGDSNIVTGTFTTHATGADGLWPTAVSLSGRWIEDQNGDPWAVLGDANVVLHHLGDADLADYLDGLVAHGITSVWWKLAMQKLESILAGMSLDKDGNSPFTGAWFQSTPTPGYWDNMERVVQQCAARGITCWLYPSWAGWTDDGGDRVIMEAATGGQMEDYGEYVGARFKDYPNIVWMNGGDRPSPGATLVARWGSIATGMLSQSVPQLWGLQGSRTVTKNDYITAASMGAQPFDLCTMYGDGLDPQTQAIAEYADNIGPLVSYEMTYENERMDSGTGSVITLDRLRYQYWGAFCAGGVGHIFGNLPRYAMDLVEAYQVSGMTWESTLNDPSGDDDRGTLDFAKHCAFIDGLSTSWVDMLPDTTDTFLTSGEGTGATRAAARFNGSGTTGLLAVAYRPHGGSATLTFDLTEFAPTAVKISKLDPVSGSYTEIGTYPTSGSQNVGSLGNNSGGDSDWVLLFEAAVIQQDADYTTGATAAAAFTAAMSTMQSISAGITADASQAAIADASASITAGAQAGHALSARAAALAAITEAIEAGDTDAAAQAAARALSAVVTADGQYDAIAAAAAAIEAGLEAGESWAVIAAAEAGLTSGAAFSASFVSETSGAQIAALSAGTQAAADFLGAVAAFGLLFAGASASDAFAASAQISASVSAGTQAGDTFAVITGDSGSLIAASALQSAFASVAETIAFMSHGAAVSAAFSSMGVALATISVGVSLGATFTASSSVDVSILGATASVRAIRRMTATVRPISSTLN